MKKKHKRDAPTPGQKAENAAESSHEAISRRGLKVIGIGLAALAGGFFALSRADSMGGNWEARLAPFLILGAYGAIGIGIMLPDPGEHSRVEPLSGPSESPEKTK